MQDLDIYNNSYLIIGAPNTKKSEVSLLLKKELKYKLINLDREKHSFFNDFTDYDSDKYYNLIELYGIEKATNYIHKYEMKHLEYVIDNISENVIIDFGNTYTLITNESILNKIKMFKNIVLLYSDITSENSFIKKLTNNRILKDVATIRINVDNKETNEIFKSIINNKKINDIL